jgi:subtilisin family serine protease
MADGFSSMPGSLSSRKTMKQLIRSLLIAACLAAGAAHAQLGLPRIGVPTLPQPALPQLPAPVPQVVQNVRATVAGDLLRRYPQQVEADPAGQPIRRAELLWLSPSAAALDTARAQGFAVLREEVLAELDVREVVMRPPAGMAIAEAAQRLRSIDASAQVDFNHIYTPSADTGAHVVPGKRTDATRRVGLIDGGIDRAQSHSALLWGCEGRQIASEHGTAIASLLAAGILYAADVYCGQPTGGAAEDVARAMAWMARERVAVVNVSLVGPANALLERSVLALVRRGHLVVAAVGNDGPAAAPLYPASYPGVVGVTGVSDNRRVLPEAAQGPQVMFAALGVHAGSRGTSYAAPIVASRLSRLLMEPEPQAAQAAIAKLASTAIDLGVPGRDDVFGLGLIQNTP